MTTQISTQKGLPAHSYPALLDSRLPDTRHESRLPTFWQLAIVVTGTLTALLWLYACAYTDLFL